MEQDNFYKEALQSHFHGEEVNILEIGQDDGQISEHAASSLKLVKVLLRVQQREVELHVVEKRSPATEGESGQVVLQSERHFLVSFLKEMHQFRSAFNRKLLELKHLFPLTYFGNDDFILMENLVYRGLRTKPLAEPHDMIEASLVVSELARFHGTSFAMISSLGGIESFLKKFPYLDEKIFVDGENLDDMWSVFHVILQCLNMSEDTATIEVFDVLSSYESTISSTCSQLVRRGSSMDVLNHGDLWTNNILFSDDRQELAFIDFQVTRVCSPSVDLSYYLTTSTHSSVNWKVLLDTYMEVFSATLRELELNPSFTIKDLELDFRQRSKYGFFRGLPSCLGIEVLDQIFNAIGNSTNAAKSTQLILQEYLKENKHLVSTICHNVCTYYRKFVEFGDL